MLSLDLYVSHSARNFFTTFEVAIEPGIKVVNLRLSGLSSYVESNDACLHSGCFVWHSSQVLGSRITVNIKRVEECSVQVKEFLEHIRVIL